MRSTAIITGSAQGLGAAIALRLAKDGFNIALNDLPSPIQVEKLNVLKDQIVSTYAVKCNIYLGDVSKEEDVKRMISRVVQDFGSLDVMVANAGITSLFTPMTEVTVEQWDNIFSINARGVFLCYKYAAIEMIKQERGGRLIGACSENGVKVPFTGLVAYGASKFAMRGLTQACALELGPHNITCNTYAPGWIDGGISSEVTATLPNMTEILNGIALRRPGDVDDIAGAVAYLASPDAKYVTGQTISVNGGRHMT